MRKHLLLAVLAAAVAFVAACGGAQAPPEEQAVAAASPPETTAPAAVQPAPPPPPPASAPPPSTGYSKPTQPVAQAPVKPPAPKPTATAHKPPEPPEPVMVEVPAGTVLEMELATALSSKTNVPGDTFEAAVIAPIRFGGQTVIPEGSRVEGTVTEAVSAKKMSGQASLTLHFNTLILPDGQSVEISGVLSEKGKNVSKRTAGVVGGSAAGGAVLGRIIGKDTKGAVIGAIAGAAIGTGVAASQKGQELKLPEGTGLSIELQNAIEVPVLPQGS